MAEKERDGAYHDWLFSGFSSYLSQLYRDDRALDWAALIRLHEPDGDSVTAFSGSLTDTTKSSNSADINFLIFAPFPVPKIRQQAPSPVWGGGLFAFWKPYFCR